MSDEQIADKIYLHPDGDINSKGVEYIRKDALLEWAKEQSASCDSSVAMKRAYDKLIEKLQEL